MSSGDGGRTSRLTRRQWGGVAAIVGALLVGGLGSWAWASGTPDGDRAPWSQRWDGPGRDGGGPGTMGGRFDSDQGYGPGMMGGRFDSGDGYGPGMMGDSSRFGIEGTGPVRSMAAARTAAARFADTLGLKVGEVMEFSNGFYAELVTPSGSKATEVLIDPDSGSVRLENGPAMMWNTEYGMPGARRDATATVSASEARRLAEEWLAAHRPGLRAGEADAFPGYYTLHTMRDGAIVGMMSVNAATGAVWYHTWHGSFVGMTE